MTSSHPPYLVDLWIGSSYWTPKDRRGSIDGVVIENVALLSGSFGAHRIAGYDAEHRVRNLTIKDFKILGKKVLSADEGRFKINEHVDNVRFLP